LETAGEAKTKGLVSDKGFLEAWEGSEGEKHTRSVMPSEGLGLQEERRNSERTKVEMPVSFEIGKDTFFGTTANLCGDGMMIESSLAPANVRRIFKALLKTDECPTNVRYSIRGKWFSRPGKIKHYHLDFSGGQSACRFSFGVWIPKMKMRDEQWL
jgi:hypothetical protein